ncbi:uncharacterized protein LOC135344583 [Halichondria panicea]|uniref:uncharacterized protein LOC135344583 n=1 Tax=Halichondria panicea TaxID=6063 RepID=UPI00312B3130
MCQIFTVFNRPQRPPDLLIVQNKDTVASGRPWINIKNMSDYLTIADLKELYIATFDARIKWRNFLLVLEISPDTIDSIGKEWCNDPDECYREGLKEWLKGGERSWEDVVKALSCPIVGYSYIARTIERDRLQSAVASNPTEVKLEVDQNCQRINTDLTVFLDKPLGKGAFGAVFKGSYRSEICAVKVLLHDAMEMQASIPVGKNEEANNAIDHESDFLKAFQHSNVVQFLATAKHPKSSGTILVIELMDCSLRSYFSGLDEESLTSECQISLSKDMACGLAYIHSKQIIHRDLCGDNVLLKLTLPMPVAKISDFGMSRLYDPSKLSSTLTAIGHRKGYLPPEAIRLEEEKYDSSLDVFSYGVIVAQIVCKLETIKSAKDRLFHVSRIPGTNKLRKLIDDCLQEDMTKRPSARDIYTSLTRGLDTVEATKRKSNDTQPVKKSQASWKVDSPPDNPTLKFFLDYDVVHSVLTVHLLSACNLPAMDRCGTSDPYVEIILYPNQDKAKSNIVEKCLNPIFDEKFVFKNVYPCDTGDMILQLYVYDHDTKIGGVTISLEDADFTGSTMYFDNEVHKKEKKADSSGTILLSLAYDDYVNSLKGTVMKLTNLPKKDIMGTSDPYVKVKLLYKKKILRKWKSSQKTNDLNPDFHEPFQFDLQDLSINDCKLCFTVYDYDHMKLDDLIGRVYIGPDVAQKDARKHWEKMLVSPQEVCRYHFLWRP